MPLEQMSVVETSIELVDAWLLRSLLRPSRLLFESHESLALIRTELRAAEINEAVVDSIDAEIASGRYGLVDRTLIIR